MKLLCDTLVCSDFGTSAGIGLCFIWNEPSSSGIPHRANLKDSGQVPALQYRTCLAFPSFTPHVVGVNAFSATCRTVAIHMNSTVGRSVKISGLKSRKDLNGGEGVVQEELSNGRLKVLMTNFPNLIISASHENLTFIRLGGDSEETSETVSCLAAGTNVKVWPNVGFFYPCNASFSIPINLNE